MLPQSGRFCKQPFKLSQTENFLRLKQLACLTWGPCLGLGGHYIDSRLARHCFGQRRREEPRPQPHPHLYYLARRRR